MALYAIGDVQGCLEPLQRLLDKLNWDPAADRLWFVGDLVNRGPRSAEVLRLVRDLGPRATTVLGNHDLHLLAVDAGVRAPRPRDTLTDVLDAPDRDELIDWLRRRPLLVHEPSIRTVLVHAGLHPSWSIAQAAALAGELEKTLRSADYRVFLEHMYGDGPGRWEAGLEGAERLRFVTNVLTRARYVDDEGRLDFEHSGAPGTQPHHMRPWFEAPGRRSRCARVVFGHWSTLGLQADPDVIATDTGCVWGGRLTAVCLDPAPLRYIQVCCGAAAARGIRHT